MKEEFEKTVYKLMKKLNLLVELRIVYIKNSYNSLYVKQESQIFVLYVDIEEIYMKKMKFEPLILHELYHIKQFLSKFPIIISNENRFFIIQKIVTDLYVDLELIKDNYYNEAKDLFLHRINNLEKIVNVNLDTEDIYRIGLLFFEANSLFKNENIEIDNYITKIKCKIVKKKIKDIYRILSENFQDKIKLYKNLIELEDSKKELLLYENKIII